MAGAAFIKEGDWLLGGLILASVVVHAAVFLHVSGIYRSSTLSHIELTLQNIAEPKVRAIPRPRFRPKRLPMPPPEKKINVVQRPVPAIKPLDLAPLDATLPQTLAEGLAIPEIPRMPAADDAWVPGAAVGGMAGEFNTVGSYLDMVRFRIESRKRYPELAKARSIEGRVTIRFVLATDGSVRDLAVAKASSSKTLDLAALRAVRSAAPFPRPPGNLFEGDLPLELTIVFELT